MGFYIRKGDKQSGDGLALTEWNDIHNAVSGYAGLTLALNEEDNIGIGTLNPSIKFAIGDSDTGFQQQGDGELGVYTNGVERVRVNQHGLVGIGTISPQSKLHVYADDNVGHFESTSNQAYMRFITNEGDGNRVEFANRTGGQAAIFTGNQDSLVVNKDGKVGIGTTAPEVKLDIQGDLSILDDLVLRRGGDKGVYSAPTDKYPLRLFEDNGWNFTVQDNDHTGFRIGPSSATGKDEMNYFVVKKDAKVGIGTTDPTIHLAIGDSDTGLNHPGDGKLAFYTNGEERIRITETGNIGIATADTSLHLAIGDSDTGLNQQGDGNLGIHTNGTESIRINENGLVGIGFTNPEVRLDVNGDIRLVDKLILHSGGDKASYGAPAGEYPLRLFENHGWNFTVQNSSESGFRVGPSSATTKDDMTYLVVKNGGNVGIGTTAPSHKLDVNGNVKATSFIGDGSGLTNLKIGTGEMIFATDTNAKVGIGTTTPGAKLDVQGDLSVLDDLVLPRGGAKGTYNSPSDKYPLRLFEDNGWNFTLQDSGQSGFRIGPSSATNKDLMSHFVVKDNGNVGIGTASPLSKLHVEAVDNVGRFESTGSQAFIRLVTSEGDDNRVEFTNRTGGKATIFTGGVDVLNVTKSGNVGIGNENPSEKLEVNGNVKITGSMQLLGTPVETIWKGGNNGDEHVLMAPDNKVIVGIKFRKGRDGSGDYDWYDIKLICK